MASKPVLSLPIFDKPTVPRGRSVVAPLCIDLYLRRHLPVLIPSWSYSKLLFRIVRALVPLGRVAE